MTTKALTWFGMAVFLLVILVPFWWIASMSFKTYEQIQFATSIYVPNPFTWENYTGLWTETRFPLWLRNSLVTALVVTATTTVVASLGGYAVARLRFPGREWVASLILILYLIPPALLFIPLYRVLAELGATNHLSSLFLSYPTFTVPFCTWLLIGFFKALPDELEEAALIDGAGRVTAFWRVLLPLAAPAVVDVTAVLPGVGRHATAPGDAIVIRADPGGPGRGLRGGEKSPFVPWLGRSRRHRTDVSPICNSFPPYFSPFVTLKSVKCRSGRANGAWAAVPGP